MDARQQARLNGRTRLVGLIGEDIGHSLSMSLHNQAFTALGLDWLYVPLPVPRTPPGRLGDAVAGLRALGFCGANVTMPHKVDVMAHLDELTAGARRVGAVNTIRIEVDGRLVGGNTDGTGFLASLREQGVSWEGRHALVLGAGGAARAVGFSLAAEGAAAITVVNRSAARAVDLAAELRAAGPAVRVEAAPWSDRVDAARPDSLIVNCTPVGMERVLTPGGAVSPWPDSAPLTTDQVVADLVYAPRLTPLLDRALRQGTTGISGLGMLVHQAALAFAWWTDLTPPVHAMHHALDCG